MFIITMPLNKHDRRSIVNTISESWGKVSSVPGCQRRPLLVSVVIPARNEARNIVHVLRAMPDMVGEVILVDGGSLDDTVTVARQTCPSIRIIQQGRRGKGNALAAGFEAATGDYVVMIDADGSMDPGEIPSFIRALELGADYAKGSRFSPEGGSDDISRLRMAGNWGLNLLTNMLFRTGYSDLCYGYNAFRREVIEIFDLDDAQVGGAPRWGDGFEIETILNTRVAKAKLAVAEVPSFERERLYGESNLRTFRDGGRVLRTILRERFGRDRHRPQFVRRPLRRTFTDSDSYLSTRTTKPAEALATVAED